ncbi:MAG TPA: hypothetical protein VD838_10410, partial [Anaeromyxobacteraceae bacterium]|nr:hypothetical protein [Anaeromyxobacteraceae bacterium]
MSANPNPDLNADASDRTINVRDPRLVERIRRLDEQPARHLSLMAVLDQLDDVALDRLVFL